MADVVGSDDREPAPRARLPLRQGAWALGDQLLSSVTNFAMAIMVARLLSPRAYGSFALAMAAWIMLLGLVRAGITHPYVVEAASEDHESWRRSTRAAAGTVIALGVASGAVLFAVGLALGVTAATGQAFAVLGVLAPALVLQDFWRFAAFSCDRAPLATANDAVWAVVQASCVTVLLLGGHRTPALAMAAWGAGAIAGAAVGVLQFRLLPSISRATAQWARHMSQWGGWFGLSSALYTGANQAVAVIVAAVAGPAALGGLRAVQSLLGPAQLIAVSGDSVVLPAASRLAGRSGRYGFTAYVVRYGFALNVLLGVFAGAFIIERSRVLRLVLGVKFLTYGGLVLPLGLGLAATAWSLSGSVALRASLAGRALARAELIGAVLRVTVVWVLVARSGVRGAAWGVFIGSVLSAITMWVTYLQVARRGVPREEPVDAVLVEPAVLGQP